MSEMRSPVNCQASLGSDEKEMKVHMQNVPSVTSTIWNLIEYNGDVTMISAESTLQDIEQQW